MALTVVPGAARSVQCQVHRGTLSCPRVVCAHGDQQYGCRCGCRCRSAVFWLLDWLVLVSVSLSRPGRRCARQIHCGEHSASPHQELSYTPSVCRPDHHECVLGGSEPLLTSHWTDACSLWKHKQSRQLQRLRDPVGPKQSLRR